MNRVVWESRHKFVYYDYESIENLRWMELSSTTKMCSEEPIVVYEIVECLPLVDTKIEVDKTLVKIFHEHYYSLVIFLSIIDKLANHVDHNELNDKLKRVFKLCSFSGKEEIKDINTLRTLLIDSKNMYKEAYEEYMETGKCNFYDKVPIPFILIDSLIPSLKRAIELKKYFALMLEFDENISSKFDCMAINNYIASRCNGYLSVNVLLNNDSDWKTYYANNGQFIQETHDYTEIDLRKSRIKKRDIHK